MIDIPEPVTSQYGVDAEVLKDYNRVINKNV